MKLKSENLNRKFMSIDCSMGSLKICQSWLHIQMSPCAVKLGRGIESEGRDVTVFFSEASSLSADELYVSKADMVDPSYCILEFKEPLRLVVLGQEAERKGVGSCGFDGVASRSASCGGSSGIVIGQSKFNGIRVEVASVVIVPSDNLWGSNERDATESSLRGVPHGRGPGDGGDASSSAGAGGTPRSTGERYVPNSAGRGAEFVGGRNASNSGDGRSGCIDGGGALQSADGGGVSVDRLLWPNVGEPWTIIA
jgi:hypothetical protein